MTEPVFYHWMVAPVVIPLVAAMCCLLAGKSLLSVRRLLGLGGITASLAAAIYMFVMAWDGTIFTYGLGEWPMPYGIVFVLDRLSATMVLLTNVLALFAYLYGLSGDDEEGAFFHFLFLMQITGINGAFLTGDMFNLFVFFEILLLTAYVLAVYGGGADRLKGGMRYVFLNLIGSALFLIGVGVLYGITGTLNMADMAVKAAQVGPGDAMMLKAGAFLMMVVFSMKAAIFPLYFWLPKAYASVTAPVAAIYAIMTKVGVYALIRTTILIFGDDRGFVTGLLDDYLLPLALLTLVMGTIGVAAARSLRLMVAYMVIASVGTILVGVGLYTPDGLSGSLYYMVHSTLISAGLFLLADMILNERGGSKDRLEPGPVMPNIVLLGMTFMIAMIIAAGLPPMSGFLGKVFILSAAADTRWHELAWIVMLTGSFFTLVAAARAGSMLFWKTNTAPAGERTRAQRYLPVAGILLVLLLWVGFAGPISEHMDRTAAQAFETSNYIQAVMGGGQ